MFPQTRLECDKIEKILKMWEDIFNLEERLGRHTNFQKSLTVKVTARGDAIYFHHL